MPETTERLAQRQRQRQEGFFENMKNGSYMDRWHIKMEENFRDCSLQFLCGTKEKEQALLESLRENCNIDVNSRVIIRLPKSGAYLAPYYDEGINEMVWKVYTPKMPNNKEDDVLFNGSWYANELAKPRNERHNGILRLLSLFRGRSLSHDQRMIRSENVFNRASNKNCSRELDSLMQHNQLVDDQNSPVKFPSGIFGNNIRFLTLQ